MPKWEKGNKAILEIVKTDNNLNIKPTKTLLNHQYLSCYRQLYYWLKYKNFKWNTIVGVVIHLIWYTGVADSVLLRDKIFWSYPLYPISILVQLMYNICASSRHIQRTYRCVVPHVTFMRVEKELLTLPEHPSSPPVFNGVRITQS